MRKLAFFLLVVSFVFSAFTVAYAAEPSSAVTSEIRECGDYKYFILDDGTVEISKYSGMDADLTIPDELDGLKVTRLGAESFSNNQYLRNVFIPNGIISIGNKAFFGCDLTSITIPNTVINVGANPFAFCRKLNEINISPDHPYIATIDGVLFSKPDKRLIFYPPYSDSSHYVIPNGIQIIGEGAFEACSSLTDITLPNSVTNIETDAFRLCSSFTNIIIPDSVVSIGDTSFEGCSVSKIRIPNNVTSIGANPFNGCKNLKDIDVSPDHPYLASIDNVLFSKPDKRMICYPPALSASTYRIPDGIKIIGNRAFAKCSMLKNIDIPDSVTSIDELAFISCRSLEKITLSQNLVCIGANAFSGCTTLESISLPNSLESIGPAAFFQCTSLKSISIPDGITAIENSIFKDCSSLTEISIPQSVTTIGSRSFHRCSSLTSVRLSDNVTSIGDYAFANCSSLSAISLSGNVTNIGDNAFIFCDTLTITAPRDSYAAQYCMEKQIKYIYPDSLDWLNN